MERKMPRAFPGIVGEINIGDLGEERPRVFCQGMESQTVDDDCENLGVG